MRRILIVTLALAGLAAPAQAGFPVSRELKCPIGGKTFSHTTTGSYSTWGSRPDGKPYGSWEFPLAMPVCPDNGLVLYKDFSKEELARLKPLIESADYRAMREAETPYYRAHWLMKTLGEPKEEALWMLLQASWEADGRPELKQRYQREFAAAAAAIEVKEGDVQALALRGRTVNALRELGEFDKALAELKSLPLGWLDTPIPEEKYGEATPGGLGRQLLNYEEIREAKNRRGWLEQMKALQAVIERRDSSSEPIDLIPRRVAAGMCMEAETLSAQSRSFCESQEMRAEVEKLRKLRAQ